MSRFTSKVTLAGLVLAAIVGVFVVSHQDADAARFAIPAGVQTVAGVPPSRDQLIAGVRGLQPIVQRVDRIEAKLVTVGEFTSAAHPALTLTGDNPSRLVWAIAVSGDVVPSLARGEHFAWAVVEFDASSGAWSGTVAKHDGTWPTFFDQLQDRSPSR